MKGSIQPTLFRDEKHNKPATPWLVLLLSLAILLVTVYLSILPVESRSMTIRYWGMLPNALFEVMVGGWQGWTDRLLLTPFTALFLHAGWLHLLGNMAYLWAFGLSIERSAGHTVLALIFLLAGGLTNALLALQLPMLENPVIGASGGVSAIIGSYLCLFPRRSMGLYLPLGMYLQFARLPALLVIGSWFVLQVIYTVQGPYEGNVIWRVHLVGFAMGVIAGLLVRLFRPAIARNYYH